MGGYSTKSVLLNGTTQYATGGDVLGFEYNQAFSVSCWVKTTVDSGYAISKRGSPTAYRGWGLAVWGGGGGSLGFWLTSTTISAEIDVYTTAAGFNDDAWHHVVVTWNGASPALATGVTIYVDGVSQALVVRYDTLGTNTIVDSTSLNVGGRSDGSALFTGSIDEVAVYNAELTADEVQWIYNAGAPSDLSHANAPSGLVSWWQMGENRSAATLPDQQGSNDLNMVNSPTVEDDAPVGTAIDISYDGIPLELETITPARYMPGPPVNLSYSTGFPGGGGGAPTIKYKMRARDNGVPAPGYVTWVTTGNPDFAGAGFAGGTPTPVGAMIPGSAVIADEWEE